VLIRLTGPGHSFRLVPARLERTYSIQQHLYVDVSWCWKLSELPRHLRQEAIDKYGMHSMSFCPTTHQQQRIDYQCVAQFLTDPEQLGIHTDLIYKILEEQVSMQ
jgi:hypothetical protein